jgi:hypothetical protein
MDILYYSNYCKYSQVLLQTLSKNNLADKISFVNIDKRSRDPKTNQVYIHLENGSKVIMPPNIHSVPALLLVKNNYKVVYGDDIIETYRPKIQSQNSYATREYGEPAAFSLGPGGNSTSNIVSEQFTFYNMTPEELSSKGSGGNRQLYNYVSAKQDILAIETPPETYRPDKISNDITLETIQQQRNAETVNVSVPSFI